LNVVDPATMKTLAGASFVLVVEGWNTKTGLGSRFGSHLLQAGFKGKYNHIGTHLEGSGGLWQQMGHQGLDSDGIQAAIKSLL
jgi:transketolase C-terminal domain/subunit